MRKKYIVLRDVERARKDQILYQYTGYDYGLANDDTRAFNEQYVTVCFSEDGANPFITVPANSLKEV